MQLKEGIKEPKTESITFRVSARYKQYLEKWSKDTGLSVGALINQWIRREKFGEIGRKARAYAHKKTAEIFDIPEKMVLGIETSEDWKKLKEFIGQEKCDAYFEKWFEINSDEQDRLAEEEDFVWNYDTPSGFIE